MRVLIVGGGSTYTPGIVNAILYNNLMGIESIVLYDNDKKRNNRMYVIVRELVKLSGEKIDVYKSENPEEAFKGVDCIFSQIRVGKMRMREFDEKIPLKYGLVGQETCGLGGLSYGLRSIGGMLEIASYVDKYCKDAWIFNYTNPEAIVADAINVKYPNLNIVNLCDMTISIVNAISETFGLDIKDMDYDYYGLNHFGWFTKITYKGEEVQEKLIKEIKKNGLKAPGKDKLDESWVHTYRLVGEMLESFDDYIPNTYLQYYLLPKDSMKYTDIEYTRANEIMDGREKRLEEIYNNIIKAENVNEIKELQKTIHGEYIVDVANAVLNNKKTKAALIIKNEGIISNFRQDAFIEVICEIDGKKITPITKGIILDDFHKGLMENQNASEKLLIKGFYDKSYQKVLQAFTLNKTCPDMKIAKQILDEFILVNGNYYPNLI